MATRRPSRDVFWRRRLLALAVVIGMVYAGLWAYHAVFGGDASGSGSSEAPSPTASVSATPSPTPSVAPPEGAATVSLSSATTPCDPETLRITPAVRGGQLTGRSVDVDLTISSTSEKACTFTPKSSDLLVVISADKTPVWDSTVCKVALLAQPVALSPGWATSVTTQWTGRGSGRTCSTKEGFASPGRYELKIGTLGGEPGATKFSLQRPKATAAPKPTSTAKPSPTPTTQG